MAGEHECAVVFRRVDMDRVIHLDFNLRRRQSAGFDGPYPLPLDPSAILMYDHMAFSMQSATAISRIGRELSRALSPLEGTDASARAAALSAVHSAIDRCRAETRRIAAEVRAYAARQGRNPGFDSLVALADLQFTGSMLEALLRDERSAEPARLVASAKDAALALVERTQADAVALHLAHPYLLGNFDLSAV